MALSAKFGMLNLYYTAGHSVESSDNGSREPSTPTLSDRFLMQQQTVRGRQQSLADTPLPI